MPNHWLFKTKPEDYSYDDLERDQRVMWSGVRNSVTLKNLRGVRLGDQILIYHEGDENAVVGTAEAVTDAYPDPEEGDASVVVVDSLGTVSDTVVVVEAWTVVEVVVGAVVVVVVGQATYCEGTQVCASAAPAKIGIARSAQAPSAASFRIIMCRPSCCHAHRACVSGHCKQGVDRAKGPAPAG